MEQTTALTNSCLICSGKKIHYDFSIEKYRVEECSGCGIMRLNPQPTDEELSAIYSSNYFLIPEDDKDGQTHVSYLKSHTADNYLDLLESYIGKPLKGMLLEVGCGYGDFLVRAAERGLQVTGVEYSSHATNIANQKLGNKGHVTCGEVAQLTNNSQRYDYIIFADVLEHVRDPRAFLKNIYSLLDENGIAIAIVPSIDSFSARVMNNKWMEFKPEHLWYFSRMTLRRLFYSENFERTKIQVAKKILSLEYIIQHFDRYPIQPFTGILRFFRKILPRFIRKYPIKIDAGGVMLVAKKAEITTVKKLSIVMAAYNEEKTIKQIIDRILVKKIPNIEIELIIIESKSTDSTREILHEYETNKHVKIILQDKPRGKGNAIREGLKLITGDFVLIQDADDEYDLEDYEALIEPLTTGEATFVLGARHGGKAWKMRQFSDQRLTGHILNLGHWCFTMLINILFRLRLKDPFTMYKVFRADCLHGIEFVCDRFDFDCELLIKLVKAGHKPMEIPVNYRSRSFTEGKKIRVFRDPITWIHAILKFRLQKS